MILTQEEQDELAAYNKELREVPAPTIEERESFIKWLDHVQVMCMNVFYATSPDELWKDKEVVNFVLIGQTDKRNTEIPRGLYCIDLNPLHDKAYRDPIAMAFAYLCKAPDDFKYVPSSFSAALPKPTAHERFSARMFFKKLINDNAENEELCDWASKLK
jgi:hypothetical protein